MIQAKFIFPNHGGKSHVLNLEKSTRINEIRDTTVRNIVQENSYNKDGQEAKIRLFHLGTELQEGKILQDYCKGPDVDGNNEVILHVFMSYQKQKAVASSSSNHIKKEKNSENVCSCSIF